MAEERPDPNWKANVFTFYFLTGIGTGGIISVLFILCSTILHRIGLVSKEMYYGIVLAAALLFVRNILKILRSSLMGMDRESISEPLKALEKFLFTVLATTVLLSNFGLLAVLTMQIASAIVVTILGAYFVPRRILRFRNLRSVFDNIPIKKLVQYNYLSIALILLITSLYHVDIILLRLLAGSDATGQYRVSLFVAEILWFAPFAFQVALLHSTANLWEQSQLDQIRGISGLIGKYSTLLLLIMACGITVLAGEFIVLYFGPEYQASVRPLLLLLPGTLGFALVRPILAISQAKGQMRPLIIATLVPALLNLILNLLLIPRMGNTGAAIATSIGYGSMLFTHTLVAIYFGYNPWTDTPILRAVGAVVLTFVIIDTIAEVIYEPLYTLIIIPPLGLVVFSAVLLSTGALSLKELKEVRTI